MVRGVTTQHWCAFALSVYDLPHLTLVRRVTAQIRCSFALSVYDLPHLTLVRRVTALRYGTTSRLVPDSGAWASAPLQCPITLRDFLQHLAVVLQVPHLKVWISAPDSGAWSFDIALVCLVCLYAWCQRLTAPDNGVSITAQRWCAFALGVNDLPHLTVVLGLRHSIGVPSRWKSSAYRT